MTAKCVDETTPRSGPIYIYTVPGLYVVQNCWPSDLLLIIDMIVL